MKKLKFILLITIFTCLTSCATIVSGGSPKIEIVGNVDEPVTITTSKKIYKDVMLPTKVQIDRHKIDGSVIKIESENYTFPYITLNKKVNDWAWGNIICGGFIGWGIDLITNSVAVPDQKTFVVYPRPK